MPQAYVRTCPEIVALCMCIMRMLQFIKLDCFLQPFVIEALGLLASEASHSLVMSTGARDIYLYIYLYIYIRTSIASGHS